MADSVSLSDIKSIAIRGLLNTSNLNKILHLLLRIEEELEKSCSVDVQSYNVLLKLMSILKKEVIVFAICLFIKSTWM